jgi:hypothetical protein
MRKVKNLSGGKSQTEQQKKAVNSVMAKLKRRGKKPYRSRPGVVRVSIKGVYFEFSAITLKWWRTRTSGGVIWRDSGSVDGFIELAEAEVARGKAWGVEQASKTRAQNEAQN